MYSAARSRPREGVARPSSRSEAMNERWPRRDAAEICSATVFCSKVRLASAAKRADAATRRKRRRTSYHVKSDRCLARARGSVVMRVEPGTLGTLYLVFHAAAQLR